MGRAVCGICMCTYGDDGECGCQQESAEPATINTGHGHVRPRPDGVRMRCGGPAVCRECQREQAALAAPQPAPSAEPVAWRTVVDDATHSVSVTKTAAEMRASLFREENRGRDFLVRVVPLYDAPQPAPSVDPVGWQWLRTAHFRKNRPTEDPGAWRPLYTAPQPTLPPEAAQAMRAVSDWLTSERIRDWRYMEGTAFWEDAAKHVAALRAALGGEAGR
jgi:hypothetical protein